MEKTIIRVACAQINCMVGDLAGNAERILRYAKEAKERGADIVLFPEMALTGYPPEDLLFKPSFVENNLAMMEKLAASVRDITVVAGFVDREGGKLFNAAAVIAGGKVTAVYHKMCLPNYGVFDEKRYFESGSRPLLVTVGKCCLCVAICEDVWVDEGPLRAAVQRGARAILSLNASPYHAGKSGEREELMRRRAREWGVPLASVNLVGGQDELVFDGQSLVIGPDGSVIARAEPFKEDLLCADIPVAGSFFRPRGVRVADTVAVHGDSMPGRAARRMGLEEEVYSALCLGLRDYVVKNGFSRVVVGVSGGVDSALVAAIAADALGKENVTAVFMASRYSSAESGDDARRLAANLGIEFTCVSIEHLFKSYLLILEPHFMGRKRDITEENIQARIRGNLLMAFSNKFGWLVLTTGNKSEMSTGYATLYGDMAGGLAVIKDVPKMLVYRLCRYRNAVSPVIPQHILDRAPTAELRMEQKDSDSLPEYETLDRILAAYVEEDKSYTDVLAMGFDEPTVRRVFNLVDKSEYKRKQSAPGIKITVKAFGRDRRMPLTNKYAEGAGESR